MMKDVAAAESSLETRIQQLLTLGRSAEAKVLNTAADDFCMKFVPPSVVSNFSSDARQWQGAVVANTPVINTVETLEQVAEALSLSYSKVQNIASPGALYILSLQIMHEGLQRIADHNATSAVKLVTDSVRIGLLASVWGMRARQALDQVIRKEHLNGISHEVFDEFLKIDAATKNFLEYLKVSPSHRSGPSTESSDDTGLEGFEFPSEK